MGTVMRRCCCYLSIVLLALGLQAQPARKGGGAPKADDPTESGRLPNGKSQQDEILKADHEKDVADARELARLASELRDEVEKGDAFILSVAELKKAEEIEKLAKRIRGRIKHY